jgi:hypothetical protein
VTSVFSSSVVPSVVWDEAATEEKRRYICNIVANAAGPASATDDVIRLFLVEFVPRIPLRGHT